MSASGSLNRFERLKREKNGLEILEDIFSWVREGRKEISPDDVERLKWYGIFYRRKLGCFMLRVRAPGGGLKAHQLRALARLSGTGGKVEVTTRQGIQVRGLELRELPEALLRLHAAGLSTMQTGMDNVRNLTGCPLAGRDRHELLDATPVIWEIERRVRGNPGFSDLPRKLHISVTGCREDCAHAHFSDIGLTAATRLIAGRPVAGFNVVVGGTAGSSCRSSARDLDVFVTPEQAPDLVLALAGIFRDRGERQIRREARFAFLVSRLGEKALREELERGLGFSLPSAGFQVFVPKGASHPDVGPQKQRSLRYLKLPVPAGVLSAAQALEVARLAETYGSGEVRLTVDQELVLVDVPEPRLGALLREPLVEELLAFGGGIRVVACTGETEGCDFAVIPVKEAALELLGELEGCAGSKGRRPFTVRWSGCSHGCGRHLVGDLGLEGTRISKDGRQVPAVNVYVGGSPGPQAAFGRLVAEKVPLGELGALVRRLPERARGYNSCSYSTGSKRPPRDWG